MLRALQNGATLKAKRQISRLTCSKLNAITPVPLAISVSKVYLANQAFTDHNEVTPDYNRNKILKFPIVESTQWKPLVPQENSTPLDTYLPPRHPNIYGLVKEDIDPDADKVIFIGDIHGCYDELIELLSSLEYDNTKDVVVFLGDILGKGPKSMDVLDFIINLHETSPYGKVFTLRGNHEQYVLSYTHYLAQKEQERIDQGRIDELPYTVENYPLKSLTHAEVAQHLYGPHLFSHNTDNNHHKSDSMSSHVSHIDAIHKKRYDFINNLPYYILFPSLDVLAVHAGVLPDAVISGTPHDILKALQGTDGQALLNQRSLAYEPISLSEASQIYYKDVIRNEERLLHENEYHTAYAQYELPLWLDAASKFGKCEPIPAIQSQLIDKQGQNGPLFHTCFAPSSNLKGRLWSRVYSDTVINAHKYPDMLNHTNTSHSTDHKPNSWHVIYGHDAISGLQTHEYATGLDTGACYGRYLSSLVFFPPTKDTPPSISDKTKWGFDYINDDTIQQRSERNNILINKMMNTSGKESKHPLNPKIHQIQSFKQYVPY